MNEQMAWDFRGKQVLVTGGTKGIGKASVLLFAEAGATVVATYSRDETAAASLRKELADIPGDHLVTRASLSDHDRLTRLVQELQEISLLPDILVCNAAFQKKATVAQTDLPLLEETFRANVHGNYVLIREVADRLVADGRPGVVVVNSSNQSQSVNPTGFAYALSKAALNHMVRHLALAYSAGGIRVNGILLGWFDTEGERVFYGAEEIARRAARSIPAGRAGDPREAARLIAYLASENAAYMTGSLVRIDGGFSLAPDTST